MAKLGDTRFILLLCFIACALILWISGKISNYIEHKIEKRSNDRFDTLVRTKLQSIEFFERDSISKIKKLEEESIKRIETKKTLLSALQDSIKSENPKLHDIYMEHVSEIVNGFSNQLPPPEVVVWHGPLEGGLPTE